MTGKPRILAVDDEERFLSTMAKLLGMRGMDVTTAPGGEEALASFKPGAFDVAVVDIRMPGMDGVDLLKELKSRDPAIEVIALTGHASVDVAAEIMSRGGSDYLLKPCPTDELEKKILAAMARRESRAG